MPSSRRASSRIKKKTSKVGAPSPDPAALLSPQSNAEQEAVANADALRQALNDEKDDGVDPEQEAKQLVFSGSDEDGDGDFDTSDEDRQPEWPSASDHKGAKYTSDSRIAKEVYTRLIAGYGSLLAFFRANKWNNQRNAHECRRLIQLVEAALEIVPLSQFLKSDLGEMFMRNIAGLAKSDEWNKPSLMDEFELTPPIIYGRCPKGFPPSAGHRLGEKRAHQAQEAHACP